MPAPDSSPGQAEREDARALSGTVHHNSGRALAKPAATVGLIIGGLAIFFSGIALGNAARKRIDRWSHGY